MPPSNPFSSSSSSSFTTSTSLPLSPASSTGPQCQGEFRARLDRSGWLLHLSAGWHHSHCLIDADLDLPLLSSHQFTQAWRPLMPLRSSDNMAQARQQALKNIHAKLDSCTACKPHFLRNKADTSAFGFSSVKLQETIQNSEV